MNHEYREGIDPLLEAAYEAAKSVRASEPDLERMREVIADRSAPILARRRAIRIARKLKPAVPLALAASVAFALWIGPGLVERSGVQVPAPVAVENPADDLLVRVLDDDVTDQEFLLIVTGRSDPDALLSLAIGE